MAWSTDDIPAQSGRVAVVTGANGGLGLEVARELARKGASVVMAARDPAKSESAMASIRADVPEARLDLQPIDLASQASVRGAAERILERHPVIHVLVNNAGVMASPQRVTEDGFELQLAVNHLGHFALTGLLLPALLASGDSRVVSVTSWGRYVGPELDPDDPHLIRGYDPWRAYGRSKMANVRFALGLERRFRAAGVSARSIAAQPGFVHTDLQARSVRETAGWTQRFWGRSVRWFGASPRRGALVLLRAATDPAAIGATLYSPRWITFGPPVRRPLLHRARDPGAIERLWELSERETGVTYRFDRVA
jgi:NAD(P)-dependent dehydrogenase (short-subunit alcohol dehydrogenase family)